MSHFVICQGEIPDVDVLFDPVLFSGFRDDGYTTLHVPAQDDLSDAFIMGTGDTLKDLIFVRFVSAAT
ncbi:hypothetical protein D3C75_1025570 [compost metagenome]